MKLTAFAVLAVLSLTVTAVAQQKPAPLYKVSSSGWQRNTTPSGEVFTCSTCDAQIQVDISAGPEVNEKSPFKTNQEFISSLRTEAQQKKFAEGIIKSAIPLQAGYSIEILRTGITQIGGLDAFQFMALVDFGSTASRDTTMVLIHRKRIIKISLNYYDGSFNEKASSAVKALLSGLKFQ